MGNGEEYNCIHHKDDICYVVSVVEINSRLNFSLVLFHVGKDDNNDIHQSECICFVE